MKGPKKGIELGKLGFGFSDVNCHLRMTWKNGRWSKPKFVKDPSITLHIGAACLHYGQECFEGIKAFRQKSGKIVIFRNSLYRLPFPLRGRRSCPLRYVCLAWMIWRK